MNINPSTTPTLGCDLRLLEKLPASAAAVRPQRSSFPLAYRPLRLIASLRAAR